MSIYKNIKNKLLAMHRGWLGYLKKCILQEKLNMYDVSFKFKSFYK